MWRRSEIGTGGVERKVSSYLLNMSYAAAVRPVWNVYISPDSRCTVPDECWPNVMKVGEPGVQAAELSKGYVRGGAIKPPRLRGTRRLRRHGRGLLWSVGLSSRNWLPDAGGTRRQSSTMWLPRGWACAGLAGASQTKPWGGTKALMPRRR